MLISYRYFAWKKIEDTGSDALDKLNINSINRHFEGDRTEIDLCQLSAEEPHPREVLSAIKFTICPMLLVMVDKGELGGLG